MNSSLNQQAWDEKVIELGGSILQSWIWAEFQESLGYKIHRFSGQSYAALAVELPLPMGKKYIYCPKGPLGDALGCLPELKKLSQDSVVIFARLEPQKEIDLPRAAHEVQPHLVWMLDLNKTEEELLIGMKPKTRYNINLAQRKGVRVREGDRADLIQLWQMMLETASRNKFRLYPQNYYFKMWEVLSATYLKVLIAEYNGRPLAGMLLAIFGDSAAYLHGGSSANHKEAMAPYLLHWEAIKLAKNSGLKFYDFGGIAGTDQTHHAWAGISRFKKGFGGFEVDSPGAFDLVFSPIWYNVYKQARLVRKLIR